MHGNALIIDVLFEAGKIHAPPAHDKPMVLTSIAREGRRAAGIPGG
jgi:hypothetical protein